MIEARIKAVQCLSPAGLHPMAFKEWGDPHNPSVLLCVHGLSRVSDDFDALAEALCDAYRVVCPDVVGRGRSGWLRDPQYYQVPQYVSDMVTLIARLDATTLHWFGTSMGGLIGMGLASLPGNPVNKLILNDIGPALSPAGLGRIGGYIGKPMRCATFDEAARYLREIFAGFGPHDEAAWKKLSASVLRQDQDGQWIRNHDPGIGAAFQSVSLETTKAGEALLWQAYDAIACPTLLVRGAESDLLTRETAQAMTQRGPKAKLVEIPGVGHAPMFMSPDQIAIARDFLLE